MDCRTKIERLGEEIYNKFGSLMKIVNYKSAKCIDIYFPEYNWTFYNATYNNFKKGRVKCPYEPYVCNKGYIGEGPYVSKIDGEASKAYEVWRDMIRRCYNEQTLTRNPTYNDCYVCDYWLNYQNFAEWFYDNYYECRGEMISLDKDILYKGNRLYSPETCVFVPQRINTLFLKTNSIRGELPIGVVAKTDNKNKYIAKCSIGDRNKKYLGVFDTIEEAFDAYKIYKENLIKQIADEYKNDIPYILYEAMYNYEVDIND